jgi:aminoglycoside phosphotransferase (APT) family kinase protein
MDSKMSLSSQVYIDDKQVGLILAEILGKSEAKEIRYLSYAFTNKTLLVRFDENDQDRFPKLELETNLISRIALETDLPVPSILYKDFSRKRIGYPFVVYSFLSGENLADSIIHIEKKEKLGIELGKLASVLHQIKFDDPKFSLASTEKNNSWKKILEEVITTGVNKLQTNNYVRVKGIEEYIKKEFSKIQEPKNYSLVHRDLQQQNLHWDNKLEKIVGVFDFESAMAGDHHFEFNFLERRLFKTYPVIRKSFYDTYSKHGNLNENHENIVRFYEVIRDLYFYNRDIQYGELDRANEDVESIERLVFDNWQVG